MSLLSWFTGSGRIAGPSQPATMDLFDEHFQRRLETLAIVSRRVLVGRTRADRRSRKKGSGIEFADFREYAAGDDFRSVDWNVYERFGRLLVRLYEEEEDLSIYFIVDCSGSMSFGGGRKLDQAKRLCAALAYVGLANLDRVTLVSVAERVVSRLPTTRGKGRIFTIFAFLRELSAGGATNLTEALQTFVARHKRPGIAVLLSDLYDPAGFESAINVLRYNRFEPYILHLIDPADANPRLSGDVRLVDCETGEDREVTVTPALMARIAETWGEYQRETENFCTAKQVPYFQANVDVPFDQLVLRVFRSGGFLR